MADTINDSVKTFLLTFFGHIRDQNFVQLNSAYENGWSKITEKHFKQTEYPPPDVVSSLLDHNRLFVLLYKDLYYRHLFANQKLHQSVTFEDRLASWTNYTELFDYLLDNSTTLRLDLPLQWIWDIIDEFIYQFQEFHHHQLLSISKSDDTSSLHQISSHAHVWNIRTVLQYLNHFANKANTLQVLTRDNSSTAGYSSINSSSPNALRIDSISLFLHFGHFSLIGLLRVHCVLGDYHSALKNVSSIHINKKSSYSVSAAYISLYYYTGFASMMMRRYADAISTFSHILLYISRLKQSHTKSYQVEDSKKKNEQMYSLLAILISFCPQRIDEYVNIILRENFAEKMIHMQRGGLSVVEDIFTYGCPKFISPVVDAEDLHLVNRDMSKLQTKIFVNEIKQQNLLPILRSYLKLYTTIDIPKLSNLLERKVDEDTLEKILLCYNHKSKGSATTSRQSASTSKLAAYSDIEFFIDGNMIHISDAKAPRRYGEYFARQINKFEDLINELKQSS